MGLTLAWQMDNGLAGLIHCRLILFFFLTLFLWCSVCFLLHKNLSMSCPWNRNRILDSWADQSSTGGVQRNTIIAIAPKVHTSPLAMQTATQTSVIHGLDILYPLPNCHLFAAVTALYNKPKRGDSKTFQHQIYRDVRRREAIWSAFSSPFGSTWNQEDFIHG